MQDNAGKAHFYAVYKVNRKEKRKEEKRYFEKKTEKKEKAKGFLKASVSSFVLEISRTQSYEKRLR